MNLRRARITSAHVISCISLFIALGGTVYAAAKINGKAIKPGSIPANRLKADSLTGGQVNEATLANVPSASKAAEATKAVSATKAAEATKAVSATKADEATRAISAAQATNATTATTATTANDAAKLGGLPAASYQQSGCKPGLIKGSVVVLPPSMALPATTLEAYNCTGNGVGLSHPAPGEYRVTFVGITDEAVLVTCSVGDVSVTRNVNTPSEYIIHPTLTGVPVDVRCTIAVL